jgi:hypothetical protein
VTAVALAARRVVRAIRLLRRRRRHRAASRHRAFERSSTFAVARARRGSARVCRARVVRRRRRRSIRADADRGCCAESESSIYRKCTPLYVH